MLPSCFDYIFVRLRQKVHLRLKFSPKFLSTLGPNPMQKARPDLQLCVAAHIYPRVTGQPRQTLNIGQSVHLSLQ